MSVRRLGKWCSRNSLGFGLSSAISGSSFCSAVIESGLIMKSRDSRSRVQSGSEVIVAVPLFDAFYGLLLIGDRGGDVLFRVVTLMFRKLLKNKLMLF